MKLIMFKSTIRIIAQLNVTKIVHLVLWENLQSKWNTKMKSECDEK